MAVADRTLRISNAGDFVGRVPATSCNVNEANPSMPNQVLALGDRAIEYQLVTPTAARAMDLVMLHEGLGSVSMWGDFPERLARSTRCRTWVFSRHGHGQSSPLRQPRRVDYLHEEARVWLPAILAGLGIERPVLFGHSDGASIALIHAAAPEHNVAAVIALAPHVKIEEVTLQSIEQIRHAYQTTDLRARLARYHANVDSIFWGWNQIWLDPAFRDWNIEALLPLISCPVLAIQGHQDEYGTMEQIESLRRALPAIEVLALDRCGHSPHRDEAAAVIEATRRFVERISLDPRRT